MFSVATNNIELNGVSDGAVTVSLTAARSETLMSLQGSFATSDATGNLTLVSATASNAVASMVVGGGVTGGHFVLSGMAEVGVGGVILAATYRVAAGTPAGSYTIPISIEAAMADAEEYAGAGVNATVGVSVKRTEEPAPSQAPTPASTPATEAPKSASNENVASGESAGSSSEAAQSAEDGHANETLDNDVVSADDAVESKQTVKVDEAQAADKSASNTVQMAEDFDVVGGSTEGDFSMVGVVFGVIGMVAVCGVIVWVLIKKGILSFGKMATDKKTHRKRLKNS